MKKSPNSSNNLYQSIGKYHVIILVLLVLCVILMYTCIGILVFKSGPDKQDPAYDHVTLPECNCACHEVQETEEVVTEDISIDLVEEANDPPIEEEFTQEQIIDKTVEDICKLYTKVDPYIVKSMIWHESRYNPNAKSSGGAIGLMQIVPKWHKDRMDYHGVTDLTDIYGNILVGIDYLNDLYRLNGSDTALVLMLYNMNHTKAREMYANGQISSYAKSVMERAERLRNGEIA